MSIAKQIEGYPDYYVSSAGNVWREKSNEFYLKLRPNNEGLVVLSTNGKAKSLLVYRIVAQAFVPVPEKYTGIPIDELEVHHIDHNRKNNRASNLQWLTKEEHQQLHSYSEVTKRRRSEALKGEKHPFYGKHHSEEAKQKMSAALKGKPNLALSKAVAQYTKTGEFIAEYASAYEAERQTKVNQGNICNCCNGKYKSAGGYIWRYN